MNSLFVRKGDTVKLLAGKNKGKTGKVISVDPEANRVVVEGWNMVSKHKKARSAQEKGGIQKFPGSIDASSVQVICPSCSKNTRVAHIENGDKKIRVCKKCNASLDVKQKVDKKAVKKDKTKAGETVKTEEKTAKKKAVKTAEKPAKKAEKTADKAE